VTSTSVRHNGDVYHAIADGTRRRLLDLLGEGERSVHALAQPFAMSRPAVSQHLRILKDAGLVTERKAGRERRYRLCAAPLREVSRWVERYEQFWTERLDRLGAYLDEHAAGAEPEQRG
jgi:DNA-binding transcriptional ArsR family regulator